MSLKINNLEEVYTATFDARSKWRNILFTLEIETNRINSIGDTWENNPEICFREGLSEWLKSGKRSWKDLIQALSTPTVGYKDVAKVIEKDHGLDNDDADESDEQTEAEQEKEKTVEETQAADTQLVEEPPQIELRPPLSLKWRKGKKQIPNKMSGPIQIVRIDNIVYIGGGFTGIFNEQEDCTVMKYDVKQDQCSKLPEYVAKWFGMTSLEDQLVVVGGFDTKASTRKLTSAVAVFESGEWMNPYPQMSCARQTPTAVSFNNYLIVAGGRDDQDQRIPYVEVLDVAARKWYTAQPLPIPRSQMKPVVIGNTLYLMGGVDHSGAPIKTVHHVNLIELVEKAISDQPSPRLWQTLKDAPLDICAPLRYGRSFLAVGGRDGINAKPFIHLYMPDAKRWVMVGELPGPRYSCACTALSNGEVIVVGGQTSTSNSTYISILNFFTITKSY